MAFDNVHASEFDPYRPFPSQSSHTVHTEQQTDEREAAQRSGYAKNIFLPINTHHPILWLT
jgi:hypothetical protein